jgi:hypothetical protein
MRVSTLASIGVLALVPGTWASAASSAPAAVEGKISIVQAVPEASIDVQVDGSSVESSVDTAAIVGPLDLGTGRHRVEFSDDAGLSVTTTVNVKPGASQDVVLHLPASVDGAPVVNSYPTPMQPIAAGMARVQVAHTATVAPADVVVDGTVVFANIANGEYATADVPAGKHVVELRPAGQVGDPLLGPLDVNLAAGAITMVYAIGNPADESMQLVAHQARLVVKDEAAPSALNTGTVGLAARIEVRPFGGGVARER